MFGLEFDQIFFVLIAAVTLGFSVLVVTMRNLFHAALALMVAFLGVAVTYVTLGAGFLAMAQLLVYIGAISILIIFGIMMTRRIMSAEEEPFNGQAGLAAFTAVIFFAFTTYVFINYWPAVPAVSPLAMAPEVDPAMIDNSVVLLGQAFVNPNAYVLPFEVASVMLLAALVGSVFIAKPRIQEAEA